MDLEEIERRIQGAMGEPMPGAEAHLLLAPRPGRPGWRPGHVPKESRQGAALLLFYPVRGAAHLLLTLRAKHLSSHRGQVSLPGGGVEASESVVEAALREAEEEVGVDPRAVRIVGRLSPLHIPVSGYVLHPVIGATGKRPDLRPTEREVEKILEVPFDHFLDRGRQRVETRVLAGEARAVPYFDVGGEKVWGATAMVLAELMWLLGAPPDPWASAT